MGEVKRRSEVVQTDLNFSVRADLFRVALLFSDAATVRFQGVHIEPAPQGGVLMIGSNGADTIALRDETGSIDRRATVLGSKALMNIAVDLFKREGVSTRYKAEGGVAWIAPDASGQCAREYERQMPYHDWRQSLAPHALSRLEPPMVHSARMARKLSDTAIGLSRAAGDANEFFELKGGQLATIATFPAWPEAVALFMHSPALEQHRGENRSTLWHPPAWVHGPRLALAGGTEA